MVQIFLLLALQSLLQSRLPLDLKRRHRLLASLLQDRVVQVLRQQLLLLRLRSLGGQRQLAQRLLLLLWQGVLLLGWLPLGEQLWQMPALSLLPLLRCVHFRRLLRLVGLFEAQPLSHSVPDQLLPDHGR